ncbi:MAG: hypothetical protein GY870_07540 [archaeon]|nr:hypothetical protein [archaeon]
MSKMIDKFELISNAFKNKPSEITPISLWKHFPESDLIPEDLAEASIRFYEKFPVDLIKVSPHGRYCVVDWGCELSGESDPISGSKVCSKYCIDSIDDWKNIEEKDPSLGEFGKQIKALKIITDKFGSEAPIMMTIFSPMMVASKMDSNIIKNLKKEPDTVLEGIKKITNTMANFAKLSIENGAHGLFIATQHSRDDIFDIENLTKFEIQPISKIISSVPKNTFTVMHVHGNNIYFEEIGRKINPEAINWHDHQTPPNLKNAPQKFSGGLLAGIDGKVKLRKANKEQTRQHILDVLKNTCNQHIMAPGCVIPQDVPDEIIEIVYNTVREFGSK